jgi:Fe(3+) dicitrate transport protein
MLAYKLRLLAAGATAALLVTAPGAFAQSTQDTAPAATETAPADAAPAETAPAATPDAAPAPAAEGTTAQPAPAAKEPQLPDVQIIQEKPAPAPEPAPVEAAAPKPKKKPAPVADSYQPAPKPKKKAAAPPPPVEEYTEPAPAAVAEPEADPLPQFANPIYGSPGAAGAAARAQQAPASPINPTSVTPANLEGFSNAATNLTAEKIQENQPRNVNEALTRVPGVIVINDDAAAHHGGIAVRGSPARRSRKMLVMEDGHPVNLALWLDPSVHYWAPLDRLESIEVIRGTTIPHGPNNNFGVINGRNLSPFGANESVVSAAIGFTKNKTGVFEELDEDDADGARTGTSDTDISARWHGHTRQTSNNFGIVLSYTGENIQGTWDTERLRVHDFYGALGWKGVDQDLVVSVTHARQKDNYSELNFTGEEDEDPPGAVEDRFFKLGHCQICYAPNAGLNEYEGEIWRSQIVHNYYLDDDTTITSRLYAQKHRRDRYQLISAEAAPGEEIGAPATPVFEDDEDFAEILLGEDSMFGRLRTFRHIGGELRGEWANRPFLAGMSQTIQAGVRYEYQDMTNRNFLGAEGEILGPGDSTGLTIFDRELNANTVSAFLQTTVKATSDFSVTPGVRFEWYQAKRTNRVIAGEESEAEEVVPGENADADACDALGPDPETGGAREECLAIEGIDLDPSKRNEKFSSFNALPGISFAYTGFHKTTVFGGYHRGMSTAVLRNEDFPAPDELGDNFELGFRTFAIKGLGMEVTGFHQILHDYQFGSSFSDGADRSFGRAERVEITGVELAARLNSQPFTGGDYNAYGEVNYTYSRGIFKKGSKIEEDEDTGEEEVVDFAGNHIPEVPFTVAALTLGLQQTKGWKWDASVTWTYRDAFFTDEDNSPFGSDPEGENGEVPEIWLLSARFNLDIGDTGASVYVAGDNLLDEFYITDREDGLKPGQGRTIWTGFKYKF